MHADVATILYIYCHSAVCVPHLALKEMKNFPALHLPTPLFLPSFS